MFCAVIAAWVETILRNGRYRAWRCKVNRRVQLNRYTPLLDVSTRVIRAIYFTAVAIAMAGWMWLLYLGLSQAIGLEG